MPPATAVPSAGRGQSVWDAWHQEDLLVRAHACRGVAGVSTWQSYARAHCPVANRP